MTILKGYLDGPFGQIHYKSNIRDGGQPLFLFHQMVQSSFQFERCLPLFATKGIKAIAVDLPGYGMSSGPLEPPSIRDYASIYQNLLDHFGFNKANVGGHHTGASIACEIACNFPDSVLKLILHGVPYYSREEMEKKSEPNHKFQEIEGDGSHFTKVWNKFHNAGNSDTSLNATHNSILSYFIAGEKEWYGHNAVYTHNIWEAVDGINCPTLLITNTGDMLNPQDNYLAKTRPDFKFFEFSGGSYQFVYDNSQEWTDIVTSFLDE